jgi:hypothetical protein
LSGTREGVINEIKSWLKDDNQPNILWIRGSPGAGKTTISSSIAAKHRCARFFFQRDVASLRDPGFVWRTIAMFDHYPSAAGSGLRYDII